MRLSSLLCAVSLSAAAVLNAQTYSFTHFAGTNGGASYRDAAGTSARFSVPPAIAVDRNGTVYVAEYDTIRRISSSGNVTTLAGKWHNAGSSNGAGTGGSARFGQIAGIVVDSTGNVFVSDYFSCAIRKVA